MLTDLRLQHFRSYTDESFEFSGGVNIIVGPNASGKTNLLEALLVLARGSSYRVHDSELVQFDQPWARLDAHSDSGHERTVKIITNPKPTKIYELAGKPYKRLSLVNTLPVVLFEPNHLRLLSGGPEGRRDYLDDLLEYTLPGFASTRRQYKRVVAQRNRLLKQSHQSTSIFFPWDIRLSQLAGVIVRARSELVTRINKEITNLYQELSSAGTKVVLCYDAPWSPESYETQLLRKLQTNIDADRQRGFTGYGPHREDLLVTFDGHPVAEAASRGEVRTAVLALKIIELRLVESAREQSPLLLLDDVFSELDGRRRHALTDYLAPYQTFITTTDADLVLEHFTNQCNVLPLS